jgi:hypothetical protein
VSKSKFRNRDYEDDYLDKQSEKKKDRKKQKTKVKYFDEFESYESRRQYDNKSQRFRY